MKSLKGNRLLGAGSKEQEEENFSLSGTQKLKS